jgi:hypothetical protein
MIRSSRLWLLVVVAALLGSVVTSSLVSIAQATGGAQVRAGAIAWEYKLIYRVRSWEKANEGTVSLMGIPIQQRSFWWKFSEWTNFDGDTELPAGTKIETLISKLGSDGWELVSAAPVSSFAGSASAGNSDMALAGATSEMLYWFKRPKR